MELSEILEKKYIRIVNNSTEKEFIPKDVKILLVFAAYFCPACTMIISKLKDLYTIINST
jgi:hypothetical protein